VQNFSYLLQGEHFQIGIEWTGVVGNSIENWPYLGNSER